MTIVKPTGPQSGHELIRDALSELSDHPQVARLLSAENTVELSPPLEVHILQPEEILDGVIARTAGPKAWRYLIVEGGELATADIHAGDPPRFASLTHGFAVSQLQKALMAAERAFGGSDVRTKASIVEFPELYCAALWLRGESDETADGDRFIPYLDGTPRGPAVEVRSDYLEDLRKRLALLSH